MFSYAPRRFTADGRRRTVPVPGDDPQGLTAADEASYDIEMHALSAGWAFARSPWRRETVLFLFRIELGYAWGDVVTTRLRAPEAVGTAGGVTAGVDCGLGVRLGPQSQLFLVVGPDWMRLLPDAPAISPYLPAGDRSRTKAADVHIELAVPF